MGEAQSHLSGQHLDGSQADELSSVARGRLHDAISEAHTICAMVPSVTMPWDLPGLSMVFQLQRFHTYVTPRCYTLSCMSTHIRHATPTNILLHFYTYVMLRSSTFSCTSTHTSCYAVACSLALPGIYVMLRCCIFSCTSGRRRATLLHVLLHFDTYVLLRCRTIASTSTHMSYYEPAQLAMLMVAKLEKGPPNNKCQKAPQMAKRCPQPR